MSRPSVSFHHGTRESGTALFGCFLFFVWAAVVFFSFALTVTWVAAVVAAIYWLFTGGWIGNAEILN